jgi:hypothetical protein
MIASRQTGAVAHAADADGVVVTITSRASTAIDLDPFIQFGLRIEDFDIVVLRSAPP